MEWLPGLVMHLGTEDGQRDGTSAEEQQRVPEVDHMNFRGLATAKTSEEPVLVMAFAR